jgi:hypothetical protein
MYSPDSRAMDCGADVGASSFLPSPPEEERELDSTRGSGVKIRPSAGQRPNTHSASGWAYRFNSAATFSAARRTRSRFKPATFLTSSAE